MSDVSSDPTKLKSLTLNLFLVKIIFLTATHLIYDQILHAVTNGTVTL